MQPTPLQRELHARYTEVRVRLWSPPPNNRLNILTIDEVVEPKPETPAPAPEYPPIIIDSNLRRIQRAVCTYYGVAINELVSHRRTANLIRPRHVAMYLAKVLTTRSLPEIGRRFGKKDHTSIMHAVRKISGLLETDEGLRADVDALIEQLGGLPQ